MSKLTKEDFANFEAFVKKHENFIIAGHKEPDGDCIASTIALSALLRKMGKKAFMVSAGPFKRTETKKYENLFLQNISGLSADTEYGLFLVDCSLIERIGDIGITENLYETFIIDHHKTAGKSTEKSIIKPASPAAVYLIQQLFEHFNISIEKWN